MNQINPSSLQRDPQASFNDEISSSLRGRRRCHLVLVSNPAGNRPEDFMRIAAYIREYDPKVSVTVVTDRARGLASMAARLALPTLAVSFVPLARFRPLRGRFLHGKLLSKSQEYELLEGAGFSVPQWQLLEAGETPDLSEYGDYLVTKPNHGKRGALVKIKKRENVGTPKKRPTPKQHQGRNAKEVSTEGEFLAQKFIYTGEWPVCYRVTSFFGHAVSMFKIEANRERRPIASPENIAGVSSIVASSRGCCVVLNQDEEIMRYAEAAHSAFPDIPLLGFDMVRELPSGKIYILEANAVGYVWHFSSPMGLNLQTENEIDLESQFDGIRKAALILAEKTQALAC